MSFIKKFYTNLMVAAILGRNIDFWDMKCIKKKRQRPIYKYKNLQNLFTNSTNLIGIYTKAIDNFTLASFERVLLGMTRETFTIASIQWPFWYLYNVIKRMWSEYLVEYQVLYGKIWCTLILIYDFLLS